MSLREQISKAFPSLILRSELYDNIDQAQQISNQISSSKKKLLPIMVIGGQTGSGKSKIAVEIAKKHNGIIVNADSRQVYRELNIGTAKPIFEQLRPLIDNGGNEYLTIEKIPHYLYNIKSIYERFTLYDYQNTLRNLVKSLNENYPEKLIILVGGTGLYIDSFVVNYELSKDEEKNVDVITTISKTRTNNTSNIRQQLSNMSIEQLQNLLGVKLGLLNESDRLNPRRLIRAIENGGAKRLKGKPLPHIYFIQQIDKDILEENIAKRVRFMMRNGLLEENQKLHRNCENMNCMKALDTIGYKEFRDYFAGNITLDEVEQLIVTHTLQYAKRQRIWNKRKI